MADPANSYSGQAWFGVGPPLVIGIVIFAAGLVLMVLWRARGTRFWDERPEVVAEGSGEANRADQPGPPAGE